MISLTIWIFLWSSFFVVAPPSLDINHSQSLKILSTHLSNTTAKMFMKRRKIKVNRTKTIIKQSDFDINSYRSSWKFVEKEIVAVRFRLSETIVHSIISTQFFVRHIHTGHIETFNEPNAIINSTLILYLHNLKHGRHAVCLLIYTSKQTKNPKYIFCQEIIFNYHKYGHHDMDSDEQRNTFFFLLTQYAIVIGMLCTLQLSHVIRKRRLLRTVYDKANALRNFMMEHHTHGNKPSPDLNNRTHTLEYLIYNLNRNSLYNFDANSSPITNPNKKKDYKKLPQYLRTPLLTHNTSLNDDEESDIDTEQSTSFKSLSHILEANKPWMTRLTDGGNIQHRILSSESKLNNRVNSL